MELPELQRNWHELGERDALWAVLTEPDKAGGKWDVEDFFRSGEAHVALVMKRLDELDMTTRGSVLDFGCGVGRLTQAFATRFDECWGVDIAPSMIERAQQLNRFADRVHYVVNDRADLARFSDDTFDLVFSVIVLQHVAPALSLGYVREFFRVCRPGGAVVFQLPAPEVKVRPPAEPLPDRGFAGEIRARLPRTFEAGRAAAVSAEVRNVSPVTWPAADAAELRLGNHWLDADGAPVAQDDGRAALPHDVPPGGSAKIALRVTAPSAPGPYVLELDLVQERVAWFAERGSATLRQAVEVVPRRRTWRNRLARRPASAGTEQPEIEIHPVARDEVLRVIEESGGTLLAVDPDYSAQPLESFTYYAAKR